jgi:tripartite-type tricarboxylate transporter receptor subunit TctC
VSSEAFRSELGVPVIFENRTGAAGVIAARTILSAPPDGHIILVQTGSHTMNVALPPEKSRSGS